jgi:hypothetical protein
MGGCLGHVFTFKQETSNNLGIISHTSLSPCDQVNVSLQEQSYLGIVTQSDDVLSLYSWICS